jgi:hypothetical protein
VILDQFGNMRVRLGRGPFRVNRVHFEHAPLTSGLLPTPDIRNARRHVSKVPNSEVAGYQAYRTTPLPA